MNISVLSGQVGSPIKDSGVSVVRRSVYFKGHYDRTVNDVYVDGKVWTAAVGDKMLPVVLDALK